MDESTCELDETLIEISLVGVAILKPEVLENVMGLVVFTGIESLEPAEEVGRLVAAMKVGDAGGNGRGFMSHGVNLL